MNSDKLFTRAVAALPEAVRNRLDGGSPLDWAVLADPETGAGLGEAARFHGRLPAAVEALANRLASDVGVAAAELAAGAERSGTAAAWSPNVTVEAEGDSYCLRNRAGAACGAFHGGVRPEALAGYTILALELAAAVHEAAERWNAAGERHNGTAESASSLLALCAVRMREHLQSKPGPASTQRTTAALAAVLERAWNGQSLKTRAALAGIRLSADRSARAPRRSYYAPMTGYRLHVYDPGELRWLRALAEEAATADAEEKREPERPAVVPKKPAAVKRAAAPAGADPSDIGALEARIRAANEDTGTLQLGSHPDELAADRELAGLVRAANGLSDDVRRRMRQSCGIGFTQALSRLRGNGDADAVRSEIVAALPEGRVPRWLQDLAAALLADAGAQTRGGLRTGSMRIHAEAEAEHGYRAIEIETGAAGQLAPLGLVEQVRLGLAFAQDAWKGHAGLRNAGKESGWILDKGEAEGSKFAEDERETLEAARRIDRTLERIQRAHGRQAPSALEEASMIADALRGIGAAARIAAGWTGGAETPDPRNPEDVARIAALAEALRERIRSIANKYIATWIAGSKGYTETAVDHAAPRRGDESAPEAAGGTRGRDDRVDGEAHGSGAHAGWRRP